MEEKNNNALKYIIFAVIGIVIIVGCIFLVKALSNKSNGGNENIPKTTNNYDYLNFGLKDSFMIDDLGVEVYIKDGKVFINGTSGDYSYNNVEVVTEGKNVISVSITYNCGGLSSIVYLTEDNKLYTRDIHQTEPNENGKDSLIASDVAGFALDELNDPNDTCGGQKVVYKDTTGNIKEQ